jgi:hypothetical protein
MKNIQLLTYLKIPSMNYRAYFSITFLFLLFSFASCLNETETKNTASDISGSEALYESVYQPDNVTDHATELVAVLITSPACGFCRLDSTKSMMGQTIDLLHLKADSMGVGFMAIGVALNWVPEYGVKHLNEISSFDEIITGNNWYNTGGLKYIFDDLPGSLLVPQLVLTKRVYNADLDSLGMIDGMISGVKSEEELVRILGVNGLQDWLEKGVPTPEL